MKYRFRLVQFLLFLGFGLVLSRLAYLQLWRHRELLARAESQSQRWVVEAPRRGPILDREGRVLAESARVGSCYADPTLLRHPESAAERLSPLLGISARELAEKIRRAPGSFLWLKRFLPVENARAVEKANLLGIGVKWEYRRFYPNGGMATPLLGYVGNEGRGLSGLEQMFDGWLTDPRPARRSLRDGKGAGVSLASAPAEEGEGSWLRLTLDRTLQYMAERELEWGLKRSRAKAGLILVQDPWTGEILAVASGPRALDGEDAPSHPADLSIPFAQWVFEPGSTFKIVAAAAALEEKAVRAEETFDCENGDWAYADIRIHDHTKENVLTFAQVMERSSNIGFAKVSLRLGKEKFYRYVRAFGFGSFTGSEIPGESAGLVRPLWRWSGVTLPVMSFGQEVGVTALQLAGAYSAVANGGTLLEPRLLKEARSSSGETRSWPPSTAVRRVMSPGTSETLKKMLQGVVTRGTGHDALLEGWTVAGKTGTAQKVDPKTGRYSPDRFIASFCGFVPAGQPRLTIVVVYDEPQGVSWGGYNAGPVFRNVAWHAMTYLGVPSDRGDMRLASRRGKAVGRPL